ncbi:MAG TPA: reverse transcriptase domain-containing protein, partial [Candidatus Deferrimicrobiaceae bacterium]|nr:reverse transcriptase domain-containing protein [Candidatus Deferrimicrobiaceae bacterium]
KPKDSRKAAGGTREGPGRERQASAVGTEEPRPKAEGLLEEVLRRENLMEALKRVRSNRGAPGVDGMTVEALTPYLKEHWPRIREELLGETYVPSPIRRVEIPKPDGKGTRLLGIPTVLDRLIQQAILQVLTPVFDPHFSVSSYGFRPGRGCHDAIVAAQAHVEAGYRFVVDMDLEKFFDRVNHDVLMARVARRIGDKRLLRLIRRYLTAGAMVEGIAPAREEGTPQGGPLSPLLSNILLDDLGKEEEMDQWIRRKLRAVLWRQWKRPGTRAKRMIQRGIERVRAWTSGMNGRGPWWNAGASHINAAVPAKWLYQQGLMSLLAEHQRLASLA